MGVRAKYVLMDSWFSMPSAIADLREHIHVICMLKDHPKWLYEYQGKKLRLSGLYARYNILSLYQRQSMDQTSFGELFRACNDEMTNLSFMVSLERIMRLALANIRRLFDFSECMVQEMLDQVMGQALKYFGFSSGPDELLEV